MKVSVVIPTYNRAHVVLDAIGSVLVQTIDDLEVIVVDDGSTDDTGAQVRSVSDPRVRYLPRPHAGVSATRNAGIAVARGTLISFLDSDDLWLPDKLAREVAFLSAHPGVDAVFGDAHKYHDGRFTASFVGQSLVFAKRFGWATDTTGVALPQREMFLCLLEEVPIATIAFTVRRDALLRAGTFDETWSSFEDWELYLRLARESRFGYLPQPLAVIRVSHDSLHLIDAAWGRSSMLGHLVRERRRIADDPEAVAAATRGITRLSMRLAWHYEAAGRPGRAIASYLRGFRETGEPGMAVRAGALLLPRHLRSRFRNGAAVERPSLAKPCRTTASNVT